MDETEKLREKLIRFIIARFSNIGDIHAAADDIVNQAFVNCRSSKTYKAENENFGYLSKIAANIAIRSYKLKKEEYLQNASFDEVEDFIPSTDAQDDLQRLENRLIVRESLKCLKEIERYIVCLRYYEDFIFRK